MGLHNSLRKWISSIEDLEYYLKRFPNGLELIEKDTGQLPLHTAVQSHVPDNRIVEFLLERYPTAVSIGDHQGRLPMHVTLAGIKNVVINNSRKLEIVRMLYNHYPKATRVSDFNGYTPLHYAINGGLLNVVIFLISKDPGCVRIPHAKSKSFPLHMMFQCRKFQRIEGSISIQQKVLEIFPTASQHRDGSGDLPLHLAVSRPWKGNNGALLSLIKSLILFNPLGVSSPNEKGRLPLHCALKIVSNTPDGMSSVVVEVIKQLTTFYRDGLYFRDNDGLLPLHIACSTPRSDRIGSEIVEVLLRMAPDTVRMVDREGNTPLHRAISAASMALTQSSNEDVILKLIECYPEATRIPNKKGNLPLHQCILGSRGNTYTDARSLTSIAQSLLKTFPEAISYGNCDGMLPAHLIALSDIHLPISDDVLSSVQDIADWFDCIIRHYPSALLVPCKKGNLPLHTALEEGNNFTIRRLLLRCPEAARRKNTVNGMLPIHVAVSTAPVRYDHIDNRLIQRLVHIYPIGLQTPDNAGRLPLHLSYETRHRGRHHHIMTRPDIQALLLSEYPDALLQPDTNGQIPLHIACKNITFSCEELWVMMCSCTDTKKNHQHYVNFPQSYQKQMLLHADRLGQLPIHVLCKNTYCDTNIKHQAIDFLTQLCPEIVTVPTIDGTVPLFDACECTTNTSMDTIHFLLHRSLELFSNLQSKQNKLIK